jgi:hypothetical protein
MKKLLPLTLILLVGASAVSAQESFRIKRKPPTPEEAARAAAEMAMNDSLLRKGDIIATGSGFVVFRGLAPDGITNQFEPARNPVSSK